MSIIDDIKSVLHMASDYSDQFGKYNIKSVARGASEQSFTFPCLISDTIPVLMASTIAKNLDRVYASWVQVYLSGVGIIDLNYIKNPRQFIKQYQTNYKLEDVSSDDEEFEEKTGIGFDGFALYMNTRRSSAIVITENTEPSKALIDNYRKGLRESLSDYDLNNVTVLEANSANKMLDAYLDAKDAEKTQKDNEMHLKYGSRAGLVQMNNNDIKRLNDMQPYVLDLSVLATKGDSGLAKTLNFSVGVKTTMHLGNSDQLVTNIAHVLKNKNFTFNFLKWTTGEISLLKDIIFRLDDINFTVANRNNPTGKFVDMLKRMKKKHLKVSTSGLKKIAPFATLVISSYEYDKIKNEHGFDLKNLMFANKLMRELFLMTLIIVDESTQTIDLLIDGNKNGFQTYALETLEREVTMNSNKLGKELTRLLGSN